MHLASLFKDYCPEIKALTLEKKKVCFQKMQNIIFQLIIFNSLKEFDFHSQVNLITRLRKKRKKKKQALSPCSKKENMSVIFERSLGFN